MLASTQINPFRQAFALVRHANDSVDAKGTLQDQPLQVEVYLDCRRGQLFQPRWMLAGVAIDGQL